MATKFDAATTQLHDKYKWKPGKEIRDRSGNLLIDSSGGIRGGSIRQELVALRSGTARTPADTGYNLGINKGTGQISPQTATDTVTGATAADSAKNFQMQNPGSQTDALGNTQNIVTDPTTGKTSITQNAGGALSAANTAFTTAAGGLANDGRAQAQDATYGYITKNYDRNKARDIEAKKQELANQGIPFSADPNSRWQKELGGINENYQSLDDQAHMQAITAGNQTYATNVGAVGTLGSTLSSQTPSFTAFQGGQSNQGAALMSLLGTISQADLAKYGIDKDFAAKLKQIAAAKSAGGGGGAEDSSGPIIGGSAPGFGV